MDFKTAINHLEMNHCLNCQARDQDGCAHGKECEIGMAINSLRKQHEIEQLVEGTIDHFDFEDAMDLIFDIKRAIKRSELVKWN